MEQAFYLILIAIPVIFYIWYASLVTKRNKVFEAMSSIDIHLQQRFDLVPNILKIAKKFMEHERSLLEDITKLRTSVQQRYNRKDSDAVQKHFELSEELSSKIGQVMFSAENYPELKSNETMVQSMQTYNEVEGRIVAARRFYNSAVTELNNAIQIFPGSFIANLANIKEMPYLEVDDSQKKPVDVDDYL